MDSMLIVKNKHFRYVVFIFILGAVIYLNSLFNPFVWDDQWLIIHNPFINNFQNISKVFMNDIGCTYSETNSYRPLQILSYIVDYHFWGLNPVGYRIFNILIHLANSILVYFLIFLLFRKVNLSFIVALFFSVHPTCVESVAYVSGRADLMVGFFILLGMILYIMFAQGGHKKWHLWWVSVGCFIFALLSKELAIIFPIVLIAYDLVFKKIRSAPFKELFKRYALFIFVDIFYIVLRLTILKFSDIPTYLYKFVLSERMIIFIKVIIRYLRVLVLPLDVHMDRIILFPDSAINWSVFWACLGFILIILLVVRSYKKSHILFFASIWFLIFLLPQSGLYPINAFMADHFLYLPSMGFFLIVGGLLLKLRSKRIVIITVSAFVLFFAVVTFKQNQIWQDEERFYKHIIKFSPYSMHAHNNLGFVYRLKNMPDEALREYKIALRLCDYFSASPVQYSVVYKNIADVYTANKKSQMAAQTYQELLEKHPKAVTSEVYDLLAQSLIVLTRYDDAMSQLKIALKLKPESISAHFDFARAYFYKDDNQAAVISLLSIFRKDTNIDELIQKKSPTREEYLEIIKSNYIALEALTQLGMLYSRYGLFDLSESAFLKVIELDQNFENGYFNLGALYWRKGLFSKAKAAFEQALRINPYHAYARDWLLKLENREVASRRLNAQ